MVLVVNPAELVVDSILANTDGYVIGQYCCW